MFIFPLPLIFTSDFCSLQYAFASQAKQHGLDPATAVVALSPRPGGYTLQEEDILSIIEKEGSSIALVLFPGVQYYTGQWFPMKRITQAAKAAVRFPPFSSFSPQKLFPPFSSNISNKFLIIFLTHNAYIQPTGLYMWLGPRTRHRQCSTSIARLGR